jgi:hypothetical protein
MANYKYHIIKTSDLSLELREDSKAVISQLWKVDVTTHEDMKTIGQQVHNSYGLSATFGYTREKEGVEYWVLPYPSNPILDSERVVDGELISKSYTLEELNNFGFDEIEDIV